LSGPYRKAGTSPTSRLSRRIKTYWLHQPAARYQPRAKRRESHVSETRDARG